MTTETTASTAGPVLGERIRDARRAKSMTQGDLAGNDYSVSYISAIERNKIRPSLRALQWLANRLGIQLADLLQGDTGEFGADDDIVPTTENDIQVILAQAQMDLADQKYTNARDQLQRIRDRANLPSQRTIVGLLLGEALIGLNQAYEAREILEHNMILTREIDPIMNERSRNLLGVAYNHLAMHMQAAECHRQCLTAIDSGILQDPAFTLMVLNNLGNDYMQLGQFQDAIAIFDRATSLGERLQTPQSLARLYWELSEEMRADGQVVQAQRYADMATEHLRAAANRTYFAQMQSNLGLAYSELNQNDDAEKTLQHARALAERAGDQHGLSVALASLARVQLAKGDAKGARTSAEGALASAIAGNDQEATGRAHLALGEALARLNQKEQADQEFSEGLALLEKFGTATELAQAYDRYADLLEKRGDVKRALEFLRKARSGTR